MFDLRMCSASHGEAGPPPPDPLPEGGGIFLEPGGNFLRGNFPPDPLKGRSCGGPEQHRIPVRRSGKRAGLIRQRETNEQPKKKE